VIPALWEVDVAHDEDDAEEPTAQDLVDAALDYEAQQRLWLRAIAELVARRRKDTDPSDRVQFALDMLYVAACERAVRILGNDLPRAQP
jgi:hypothetical protein